MGLESYERRFSAATVLRSVGSIHGDGDISSEPPSGGSTHPGRNGAPNASIDDVVKNISSVYPTAIPGLESHSAVTKRWNSPREAVSPGSRSRSLPPASADHVWHHIIHRSVCAILHGLWFLLSYQAGLRPTEITALLWSDLFDEAGNVRSHILVRGETIIRGAGWRLVPVHPQLAEMLLLFKTKYPDSDRVAFTVSSENVKSAMSASSLLQWFNRLFHATGLIGMTNMSGRHAFIERVVEGARQSGASIMQVKKVVGHKSLSTTVTFLKTHGMNDAVANLGLSDVD